MFAFLFLLGSLFTFISLPPPPPRRKINTEGDVPPSMSGSCAVCVDRVLYLFGGHHSRGNTNKVSVAEDYGSRRFYSFPDNLRLLRSARMYSCPVNKYPDSTGVKVHLSILSTSLCLPRPSVKSTLVGPICSNFLGCSLCIFCSYLFS